MNSYTISELLPSSDYNVMLCLKKNKHIIPVIVMMMIMTMIMITMMHIIIMMTIMMMIK